MSRSLDAMTPVTTIDGTRRLFNEVALDFCSCILLPVVVTMKLASTISTGGWSMSIASRVPAYKLAVAHHRADVSCKALPQVQRPAAECIPRP